MRGIELMPLEMRTGITQRVIDQRPSLSGNVWVLSAPDQQQLARDLTDPVQTVVVPPLTKAALVDAGRIETGSGQHVSLHRRAKRQMPPMHIPMTPSLPVECGEDLRKSSTARASPS